MLPSNSSPPAAPPKHIHRQEVGEGKGRAGERIDKLEEEREDILEALSQKVVRHQIFGIDLVELMEKQNRILECPELMVPRFLFEIVKQLDVNGMYLTLQKFTGQASAKWECSEWLGIRRIYRS